MISDFPMRTKGVNVMNRFILIVCALFAFSCAAAQCQAITKKGTQCKRQAANGSQCCWQHGEKAKMVQSAAPNTDIPSVRTVAATPVEVAPKNPSGVDDSDDTGKDLNKENEALRRENQKLRRELVRQKEGEPVIDMSGKAEKGTAKESSGKERIVDDGGWWLSSSGKRHNSKCRYYKTGRGRPCNKEEGTACKKCGG